MEQERERILAEIRRLATETERAPGQIMFERATGIAAHQWRGKFWARWGDALAEAGYGPNAWTPRLETDLVLLKIIEACRHYGKLPTKSEFELYRRKDSALPSYGAMISHFGSRSGIIAAVATRISDDENYADINSMLPNMPETPVVTTTKQTSPPDGSVYLIKSGNYYKIGRSDDIERRIKEIRIALPDKATVVHWIRTDDPPGIEAYWHSRFSEKRANGEWFRLSSLDVSAFKKRRYQ